MKRIKVLLGIVIAFILVRNVVAQERLQVRNYILERLREENRFSQEEFARIREEAQKEIIQNQEEFKNRLKEKAENVLRLREKSLQQLRESLKNIRDEKRREIIGKVYFRIQSLNDSLCVHFLAVLEKLELILERIESRTAKAKTKGFDTAEVENDIALAREKIAAVKEEIAVHAEKVYSFNFSKEEEAKIKIGEIRQAFHQDIMGLRQKVKEAFQLVREAAVKLAQIRGVDEIKINEEQ